MYSILNALVESGSHWDVNPARKHALFARDPREMAPGVLVSTRKICVNTISLRIHLCPDTSPVWETIITSSLVFGRFSEKNQFLARCLRAASHHTGLGDVSRLAGSTGRLLSSEVICGCRSRKFLTGTEVDTFERRLGPTGIPEQCDWAGGPYFSEFAFFFL